MRVFQFMSATHAADNLRKGRVKASFLSDMNDPFELLSTSLKLPEHRKALRSWKDHMNAICRVLCFSRTWHKPVMWSHYADKHRGVCLGFDVPDDCLLEVTYETSRLETQFERQLQSDGTIHPDFSRRLLTTKFKDWQYEDEVRMFLRPEDTYEELGLHFHSFSKYLVPKVVLLGPRCTLSEKQARAAMNDVSDSLNLISTRLAFKSFRVVHAGKSMQAAP